MAKEGRPIHERMSRESKRFFLSWGSAQLIEKARFGEAKPRKSKLISLFFFGHAWLDSGKFEVNLEK
jgi:hypothetical protein